MMLCRGIGHGMLEGQIISIDITCRIINRNAVPAIDNAIDVNTIIGIQLEHNLGIGVGLGTDVNRILVYDTRSKIYVSVFAVLNIVCADITNCAIIRNAIPFTGIVDDCYSRAARNCTDYSASCGFTEIQVGRSGINTRIKGGCISDDHRC